MGDGGCEVFRDLVAPRRRLSRPSAFWTRRDVGRTRDRLRHTASAWRCAWDRRTPSPPNNADPQDDRGAGVSQRPEWVEPAGSCAHLRAIGAGRLSSAPQRLHWPSAGVIATVLALGLTLVMAVAIPLASPRIVLPTELVVIAGAVGFGIFYRIVRSELSLVGALGAYLLAVASFFVTLNNLRVLPSGGTLPSATFSDVLMLGCGLTLAAAGLVERYRWPSYPTPVLVGAGLLAFSVALTTALQPGFTASRPTGALFLTAVVLTPLVVASGAISRSALVISTLLWLASAAANGIVALLDVEHITHIGALTVDGRAFALSDHPNNLGISCAMLVPVGAALFLARSGAVIRVLVGTFTLFAAIATLLSGSRSATLAAVFGLIMIPLLGYRRRIQTLLLITAALAALGVGYAVSASFFISLERLTGQLSVQGSDAIRVDLWKAALTQIAANPVIGNGYSSVTTASDFALQVLVSGGVIGLMGYALFVIGFVALGVHCCRDRTLDRELSMLSAGLTASALVFLVAGVVSDEIYDRFLYWPFGLILAIWVISRRSPSSACGEHRGAAPVPSNQAARSLPDRARD